MHRSFGLTALPPRLGHLGDKVPGPVFPWTRSAPLPCKTAGPVHSIQEGEVNTHVMFCCVHAVSKSLPTPILPDTDPTSTSMPSCAFRRQLPVSAGINATIQALLLFGLSGFTGQRILYRDLSTKYSADFVNLQNWVSGSLQNDMKRKLCSVGRCPK